MINPRNIDPPSGSDKVNLDQAIVDIIERIGAVSASLGDVQIGVGDLEGNASTESVKLAALTQEITEAKLGAVSLKDKLIELQNRQIIMTNLRSSYTKTVVKTEGKILKEIYSGGVNQEIRYIYTDTVLSEKQLYVDEVMIGNIIYSVDIDGNEIETNNGFDAFNVGSDSVHLSVINELIGQLLALNIQMRLQTLESKTATGNFDGQVLLSKLDEIGLKIKNLEMVAFNEIDTIINFPQINTRIQTLEFENENEANVDEFVFDGIMDLNLTGAVSTNIEVTCDGIEFTQGSSGDFTLSLDKQKVLLMSKPLTGSTIRCKYY